MNKKTTFWDYLENYRKLNKISKKELAIVMGISYTQLSELTSGVRISKPTMQVVLKFCDYYKVDIDSVLKSVTYWKGGNKDE